MEALYNDIFCPKCGFGFKFKRNDDGKITGGLGGAVAGAIIGANTGIALGPLGAIAGTIPGFILGGVFGKNLGNDYDKPICPKCDTKFEVPNNFNSHFATNNTQKNQPGIVKPINDSHSRTNLIINKIEREWSIKCRNFKNKSFVYNKFKDEIIKDVKKSKFTPEIEAQTILKQTKELQLRLLRGGFFHFGDVTVELEYEGTKILLEDFVKSYNYVKKIRHLKIEGNTIENLNKDSFTSFDLLIEYFTELAIETKDNQFNFYSKIKNSNILEIDQFYRYLEIQYLPSIKFKYLNTMFKILPRYSGAK
jgi:hypothetical protein